MRGPFGFDLFDQDAGGQHRLGAAISDPDEARPAVGGVWDPLDVAGALDA